MGMGTTDLGFEPVVHGGREPNGGGVSPAGSGCVRRAVRLAQRVRAAEHGEVLDIEAVGGEGLDHEADVAVQERKLAAAGGVGCAAVPREEREGEGEVPERGDGGGKVHVEERGAGRASGDEACIRERGVRT